AAAPVASAEPDPARLLADVTWLADDLREGRRAGTPPAKAVSFWLEKRLQELGLEPAGEDGFRQVFEVPLPAEDGGGSWIVESKEEPMKWPGEAFEVMVDYIDFAARVLAPDVVPLFCSDAGELRGTSRWVGYGISKPELGLDDYAATPAEPAEIFVMLRGVPPYPPAAGGEGATWADAASLFNKVMTAKRKGAKAVFVVQHPDEEDPLPRFDTSRSAQAGIPALMITAEAAKRLGIEIERLVEAAEHPELDGGGTAIAMPRLALNADVRRQKGKAWNVLGRLKGERSDRVVVLGAHYDHLGRGGDGSLAPDQQGEIHNGADDNASGTAVVLEIARLLAAGPPPGSDVVFARWSGEEQGLLGSEHWAQHPTVPLENVRANLNLDMVGRAGKGKLQVLGAGTAAEFAPWLEEMELGCGLDLAVSSSGQGVGGSDHMTFLKRRIPALHFFSGVHADYHKPSDDVERFEAEGAAKVAALGGELVRRMAAADSLAYVEPPAPAADPHAAASGGWRVWFGTVPEYSYEGPGLKLSGTSAGSPAEKAGLLAGDVIVKVGDHEIGTIYDFMFALSSFKPGDVVETRFLREGKEESVRVTLATRDAQ
ncbi:MAG TPA: M28 family peptidase, partial [Planctomycetota bacterium]|nr:M28 family peptidase [Planctomycetota bacterium]